MYYSTFHTSHTQTLICLGMSQKEIQNICLLKKVSLHSAPRLQCKLRHTVCPCEAGTITHELVPCHHFELMIENFLNFFDSSKTNSQSLCSSKQNILHAIHYLVVFHFMGTACKIGNSPPEKEVSKKQLHIDDPRHIMGI